MKRLTWREKDLVIEALTYYRDDATHPDKDYCGLDGNQRKILNRAIDKINKLSR